MKVYCDTGAYSHDLRDMERLGEIEVFQFKYENKNKRIKNIENVCISPLIEPLER